MNAANDEYSFSEIYKDMVAKFLIRAEIEEIEDVMRQVAIHQAHSLERVQDVVNETMEGLKDAESC